MSTLTYGMRTHFKMTYGHDLKRVCDTLSRREDAVDLLVSYDIFKTFFVEVA